MKVLYRLRFIAVLCATAIMLSACGSGTEISPETAQRIETLGNTFIEDLRPVILNREDDDYLTELDAVVVTGDKTYHIPLLYALESGESGQLTAVIKTKSFVVIRIVMEGEGGYYFRYELDPFDESKISVSSQTIDSITLEEDDALGKVELTLLKEKSTPIVFTFKNITGEASK